MSPARSPRPLRRHGVALALAVIAASVPGAALAAAPEQGTTPAAPAAPAAPAEPTGPTREGSWVARVVIETTAWSEPSDDSKRLGRVETQSPWGGSNRLLVLANREVDGVRWLQVRLPGRPNANRGWIVAGDADVFTNGWRLEVSRAKRRIVVWHDGRVAKTIRVVVGAPSTPTPPGLFAIADELRQPDAKAFVGGWVMPLTAHSNVLEHYDGGDGQVALHGRGGASLRDPLGSARSHGCIRLANADIAWLAKRLEAGTPVVVS